MPHNKDLNNETKNQAGYLPNNPLRVLTDRQREIVTHIQQSKTNKAIGSILGISEKGVKYHMAIILKKLSVKNRIELINLLNDGQASYGFKNDAQVKCPLVKTEG